MKIKRWTRKCKGCGEAIDAEVFTDDTIDIVTEKFIEAIQCRCRGCAREVAGLALPHHGTLQHGTGGGVRVIRETKTH